MVRLLSHFFLRKNHETKPIAIQIDPFEFRQYLKCIQLVKLCSKNLNRTAVTYCLCLIQIITGSIQISSGSKKSLCPLSLFNAISLFEIPIIAFENAFWQLLAIKSIEQIIPKIDPGEIGSAFHRAGADIVKKNHLWMDTKYFSPINF